MKGASETIWRALLVGLLVGSFWVGSFSWGRSVTVTVSRGPDGGTQKIAGARVCAGTEEDRDAFGSAVTDSQGKAVLTGLPVSALRVTASASGYRGESKPLGSGSDDGTLFIGLDPGSGGETCPGPGLVISMPDTPPTVNFSPRITSVAFVGVPPGTALQQHKSYRLTVQTEGPEPTHWRAGPRPDFSDYRGRRWYPWIQGGRGIDYSFAAPGTQQLCLQVRVERRINIRPMGSDESEPFCLEVEVQPERQRYLVDRIFDLMWVLEHEGFGPRLIEPGIIQGTSACHATVHEVRIEAASRFNRGETTCVFELMSGLQLNPGWKIRDVSLRRDRGKGSWQLVKPPMGRNAAFRVRVFRQAGLLDFDPTVFRIQKIELEGPFGADWRDAFPVQVP